MYSQLYVATETYQGPETCLTSQNDGGLELEGDGYALRFPAVWLRDNCPCPECLDPGTGQKLKDITELPAGLAVSATEEQGESVVVTYAPDGHRSAFSRSWLAGHALGPARDRARDGATDRDAGDDGRTEDAKELWLPAGLGRPPEASWPRYLAEPAHRARPGRGAPLGFRAAP